MSRGQLVPRAAALLTRRGMLRSSALGGLGWLLGTKASLAIPKPQIAPVVQTTAGAVHGYVQGSVFTFKGIPYGASTAGLNRFVPPRKPHSWGGIRPALRYGPTAMQPIFHPAPRASPNDAEISELYRGLGASPPNPESEDCLVLNVWTASVTDDHRRPVMVWLHGAGFGAGSGDWGWTDGTNLACHHDVVVVSINHRLNIFGFLSLAEIGGDQYAQSGNVGMLDVVAALQWVRDNITAFGGDPRNVTIFGQSGGGVKVDVLMAMPLAQGLFHRAINMSGPCTKMLTQAQATQAAERVLDYLGIHRAHLDRLQRLPAQTLVQAMDHVLLADGITPADGTWRDGTWLHVFDPVVDGLVLPRHPFDPDAPAASAQVPMLLGTAGEDSRLDAGLDSSFISPVDTPDEEAMYANLKGLGIEGERAVDLVKVYRATRSHATAADIFSAIASDLEFRRDIIAIAERKSRLGKAPVYLYDFSWASPAFGGKYGSAHGFDQAFAFSNLDKAPGLWGGHPDPRGYELARRMSKAWVAFARTGNPNHPGLPEWRPYTEKDRATMVLNYSCELASDPRKEDRRAIDGLHPA